MSPANILIIFILVIMIFMFIVIIACGKTVAEQCDPKPPKPGGSNSGGSGSSSGSGKSGGSGGFSTASATTQDDAGASTTQSQTDDAEEIQCRNGEQECGHNQTSNINEPIKIPQKFLDFFNSVATSYGLRGDLNDTNWEKVSTSKNARTQSLNNLDIKIAKYYNSIDTTKGDDFMPTTAYENSPWYKDSAGFRNMLTLMQTQLMRAYISKESQYYQSKDLRNILDFACTQIMSHFPKRITSTPWGDVYLWHVFAVTVPQTLFIWLICRNCKMNIASDENNIDQPMFTKTLRDVDKIDRIAIDIFNKFFAYPTESDCRQTRQLDISNCWIIGLNVPRPTTESFIMAFPWIMGRILTTMYTQTLLLDDLLVSFKITAADKANNAVKPDQIIEIVKPLAGMKFENKLTTERRDSLYENLVYQDGTSTYRFQRFDIEIINSLRLSTEMINNLLFEGKVASEKEHFYRKCVFSKVETPFLQIHPHQYFPFKKNRVSDNSNQGKYGAFVMNISGLIAMKQKSWSLVYRGQRSAIYSIVHNEDMSWEDSDIQIYSKEIFDKNTSENVEQVAFPFKTGVIRSDATKDKIMAVRYAGKERTLYSEYTVLVSVHLNDNVNHSAVGLGNSFKIDTSSTYFLSPSNPVVENNPDRVRWWYDVTELILVTNNGMHVCLIINDYKDVQDTWDSPNKHTYWLGLAHTYNTGIKTQTVKTIKENQSYQLGNMYIYLNSGFKSVEVSSFKDGKDITQYGLRGQVEIGKFTSYSIVHTKGNEESSTVVPNELLTKPTMTYTDKKLNGRIETFDWIYTCVDNKLYLYDRLSQTLKIGTQVAEEKQLPTRILVNRGELRQLIGDERLYKYRVRASSDAQAYYNYDEEGDRQNAKTKDVASYDKNNADPEDSTINYQVTLRDKEAFPNKNLDELTCNQQLREYDRFSYEVRIDDVTEFN